MEMTLLVLLSTAVHPAVALVWTFPRVSCGGGGICGHHPQRLFKGVE
jgi:hypothetical protein